MWEKRKPQNMVTRRNNEKAQVSEHKLQNRTWASAKKYTLGGRHRPLIGLLLRGALGLTAAVLLGSLTPSYPKEEGQWLSWVQPTQPEVLGLTW